MGKNNTHIEIEEASDVYTGKVISSDNADLNGKVLLKNVKKVDNEWKGEFFAPKKGKWLNAIITRKDNMLSVKVKSGALSKTLKWTEL